MRTWAAVIPGPMYATERLYHHETLPVGGTDRADAALPAHDVPAGSDPGLYGISQDTYAAAAGRISAAYQPPGRPRVLDLCRAARAA
jgi:hypothetical protein